MARSVYHSHGTANEQLFHEDLVVEALHHYGQEFFYIPRALVAKDEILGEDRLSEFKSAYGIEMYLENVDGFDGQGAFIQKFGLMMEQSATLVVARRRWQQLVGRYGQTIIPNRPCEGDLIYFPLTGGLFEIKFVTHQDPFYQIGKLFVFKLQVELFQYASEKMNTGIKEIDDFESLKSYDTSIISNGAVSKIEVTKPGSGYLTVPTIKVGVDWTANTALNAGTEICHSTRRYIVSQAGTTSATAPTHTTGEVANGTAKLTYDGVRATATAQLGSGGNADKLMRIVVNQAGTGYAFVPQIFIVSNTGEGASATAYINNMDAPMSYGDNEKFKEEAESVLFNEDNPFGDFN